MKNRQGFLYGCYTLFLFLAFLPGPARSQDTFPIGTTRVLFPVPEGFMEISGTMPELFAYMQSVESKGLKLLGVYLEKKYADTARRNADQFIPLAIKFTTGVREEDVSADEFANLRKMFRKKYKPTLGTNFSEVVKRVEKAHKKQFREDLDLTDPVFLGFFEESPSSIAYLMLARATTSKDGEVNADKVRILSCSVMHVRKKIVDVFVVKDYNEKEDLKWTEKFTRDLSQSILKANQP